MLMFPDGRLRQVFLCVLLCSGPMVETVFAQVTSGAALFQTIVVSPRSHALGEATMALSGYAGAAQLNPASIGRAHSAQLTSSFNFESGSRFKTPWLPNVFSGMWIVAPSVDVKLDRWAFGYLYKDLSFGRHEARDAQNNPVGTYRSYDSAHKLTVARDLTRELTLGASANLISSRKAPSTSPRALSLDLGVLYSRQIQSPEILIHPSAGWSLTDFGTSLRYNSDGRDPLAMTMRGGLAVSVLSRRTLLERPIASASIYGSLTKELALLRPEETEFGLRYVSDGPLKSLFTGWKTLKVQTNPASALEPEIRRVNAWEQMRKHGGIEFSVLDAIFLRWGDQHESRYVGNRDYATRGWGIDLYYLALERSRVRSYDGAFDGMTYSTLTARYPLRSTPDNFWPALIRRVRG